MKYHIKHHYFYQLALLSVVLKKYVGVEGELCIYCQKKVTVALTKMGGLLLKIGFTLRLSAPSQWWSL